MMNGLNMNVLSWAPALPHALMVQVWLYLGWAVVLSALALRLTRHRLVSGVLGGLMCLPWVHAPVGYIALAFQAPSLVLVAWSVGVWWPSSDRTAVDESARWPWLLSVAGVLLGWALCVDTLNLWPQDFKLQLFAWGFQPASLWVVLGAWLAYVGWLRPAPRWVWRSAAVLAVYVLLRLPTGNVWDALLDPFVWIALHVQLVKAWARSSTHAKTALARAQHAAPEN
jgi:hypothetical protein